MENESKCKEQQSKNRLFLNLMERAGTTGRYQQIMLALWSLVLYLCGCLLSIVPYLLYQDPYQCTNQLDQASCQQFVCSLSPEDRISYTPYPSIQTLANSFGDYRCPQSKLELNSVASMLFFGGFVGYLLLALVGSRVGRKKLMIIALGATVFGFLIVSFSRNLLIAGIGLFLASLGLQDAYYISFFFISETVSEKYRQKYLMFIQIFFALGSVSNVGYFYFIGNWKIILLIFYLAPTLAALIGTVTLIKDTPMFLVTKKSTEKALKDLEYISKINKIINFNLTLLEIEEIKKTYLDIQNKFKKQNFSLLDLFKFKSLRKMTVFLICLQIIISFMFYAPSLMLAEYKMSIYISGLVVGLSQIIALFLCFIAVSKLRRRSVAFCFFTIACGCSIILFFLWDTKNPSTFETIQKLVLIFVFRFAITFEYSFYILHLNELYSTQVRVLGTSLVSVFGGLSSTMAPILIQICESNNFPIMILFISFSILGVVFSSQLKETFQQAPSDLIQEFQSTTPSILPVIIEKPSFLELRSNTTKEIQSVAEYHRSIQQ